jgi:hypothetical protein
MPTADAAPWRTRLIGLTAIAVLILLIMAVRAAAARSSADTQRAILVDDLRRLATAADAYFARAGRYPAAIGAAGEDVAFTPSPGVTIRYERWSSTAWSAVADTPGLTVAPARCGIWVGDAAAAPHRAATTEGTPACW